MGDTRTQKADVPIEHVIPEGTPLIYCNHAMAQVTDQDITLTLFQIATPMGDLATLKSVRANCLGRFVLTPHHAIQLFQVLQGVLEARGLIERAVITPREQK